MGCSFCEDCRDCTVGKALDCEGDLDPYERQSPTFDEEELSWSDPSDTFDECSDIEEGDILIFEKVHCVACGLEIEQGWKFCLRCGERVLEPSHCTECGKPLEAGWGFCPWCGKEISKTSSHNISSPKTVSAPAPIPVPVAAPIVDTAIYDEDIPF